MQELFREKAAQNAIRGVSYFLLIIGLVCTGAAVGLLIKSHVFGFIVLLLVGLFLIIGFWGNNKKSFYDEEAENIHNQFLEGESSLRFLKRDLKL